MPLKPEFEKLLNDCTQRLGAEAVASKLGVSVKHIERWIGGSAQPMAAFQRAAIILLRA